MAQEKAMESSLISIEQVAHPVVRYLRQKVFYPGQAPALCALAGDEGALHFAAFYHGQLIAIASVFLAGSAAQLRQFATDPDYRRQGVGTRLLQYLLSELGKQGVNRLTCEARQPSLFRRLGFVATGQFVDKNGRLCWRLAYPIAE